MTGYQFFVRVKHYFMARHWRGAAIHSPTMYQFVRKYALENRGEQLIKAISAPVVDSVEELKQMADSEISVIILREPFLNRREHRDFREWYAEQSVVTAHFQGLIVLFFDKKLQKQQYIIRN